MKNSIFYLFVVALLFTSCKEVLDGANNEEHKDAAEEVISAKSGETDTSCIASEKIYPQTAWVWAQSWVATFNYLYPSTPIPESPELFFEHDDLLQLNSNNATGVLLYYILFDKKETIPSLAMVNTFDCIKKMCDGKCVLVSRYDPKNIFSNEDKFISYDSFKKYQQNWIDMDKPRDGYIPVNGYNYSWATLNVLSNVKGGVRVKYGVRTIDISENLEYGNESSTVTGNIVACNVLIGWIKGKSFEEALREVQLEDLDFAKPCPEYCGQEL